MAVASFWENWMRQLILAACAALTLASPAAHALFSDDDARKAILELRARQTESDKRIADLTTRLEASQRGQLELANQIEALRAEVARLRGQVETLGNEVAVQGKRTRELYTDVDSRLKRTEPATVTIDGRSVQVDRAEQVAFDAALEAFRAGDFKTAIDGFRQLLARFPSTPYAAAAQYWLGSAYYANRDYRNAIIAQQVVVDRHKDSPRAPEALLSMAASQLELKDKKGAAASLNRVIKDYPDTEAARLARERLPATR
jgi:tol-pal system protein YbgF